MGSETAISIENLAKNTVGYAEAENKESFMTGVNIGVWKAELIFTKQIESLIRQLESYKNCYEAVTKDITTLVSIIEKYKSNE